jgi:hypothetical protein
MKMYDPKKKDSFVMQFGFSYPYPFTKNKTLIRKYEVSSTKWNLQGSHRNM